MVIVLVIALVLVVLVFGVSSAMQSYASAQQAEAVIETAQATQMATFANVVVIVVMALVLVLILAGIVYLVIRLSSKTKPDGRQDRLEAGRQHGAQLRQILARIDAKQSLLEDSSSEEFPLVIADDEEVDEYLSTFFKDW